MPGLRKEKPKRAVCPVWQGKWRNVEIANCERTVDEVLFGHEITLRPRTSMKGITKYPAKIVHRGFVRVYRRRPAAQIAKATAIVQAHDVVGVGMREKDGIEMTNFFAQTLDAELGRRVNDEAGLVRHYID